MDEHTSQDERSRPTRREILKKAGLMAGTTIWVAPAIQSIGVRRAWAVSPPPGCFAVKIEQDKTCDDIDGKSFCGIPPAEQTGGCSHLASVTIDDDWTVTLTAGCTFVSGFSKCDGPDVSCNPADLSGSSATFHPCPNPKPPPEEFAIGHI
jgi:hypothetical protein